MSHSKNRSLAEVLIAVTLACFLLGFVAVLCIGNYYRARKAMERQRQKRLARLSGQSNGAIDSSPRSIVSGTSTRSGEEQQHALLSGMGMTQPRRRNADEDLLLQPHNTTTTKPNILAV